MRERKGERRRRDEGKKEGGLGKERERGGGGTRERKGKRRRWNEGREGGEEEEG